MASPCEESRFSLWDKLVPDLQQHIYGLAVEQHCRELMQTQVRSGIIHAVFKKNQAAYQQVEDQMSELTMELCRLAPQTEAALNQRGQGLVTLWQARGDIQGAFEDAMDSFMSSIASLPRHIRRMQIRQLRDVIPMSAGLVLLESARERESYKLCGIPVWLSEAIVLQENEPWYLEAGSFGEEQAQRGMNFPLYCPAAPEGCGWMLAVL